MSGLTATGFDAKSLETIIADLKAALRQNLGQSLSLDEASVLGILVGIFADRVVELWELAEDVYGSQYPDSATGAALDAVCAITGTVRNPATKSTVTGRLNIDAGVTVPAGSVVSVDGNPAARFVTLSDAVGPGPGAQNVPVEMEAEDTGPTAAPSLTLTVIETPVAGWNTATNPLDAELGSDIETETALRLRREAELAAGGAGTVDSIRAALLQVADVEQARVFENVTLTADGDGVPGKAFEAVVLGGANQDILDEIWDRKPAGIEAHGTTLGNVTDSQGDLHTMKFSRPTTKNVWVIVHLTEGADYPADGDAQVKAALVAWAEANLGIGDDVITSQLYGPVFGIAGVEDVTSILIGFADPPGSSANLAISTREIADFDTSRISVVST